MSRKSKKKLKNKDKVCHTPQCTKAAVLGRQFCDIKCEARTAQLIIDTTRERMEPEYQRAIDELNSRTEEHNE